MGSWGVWEFGLKGWAKGGTQRLGSIGIFLCFPSKEYVLRQRFMKGAY
jgi:hypothetical protein